MLPGTCSFDNSLTTCPLSSSSSPTNTLRTRIFSWLYSKPDPIPQRRSKKLSRREAIFAPPHNQICLDREKHLAGSPGYVRDKRYFHFHFRLWDDHLSVSVSG